MLDNVDTIDRISISLQQFNQGFIPHERCNLWNVDLYIEADYW